MSRLKPLLPFYDDIVGAALAATGLDIEAEVHDVAFLDGVFLAFEA